MQCKICFEEFARKDVRSAACKHGFCLDCWNGYISTAIGNGPAVLDLRCPLPSCSAEVRAAGGLAVVGRSQKADKGAACVSRAQQRVSLQQQQQQQRVMQLNSGNV